MHAAITHYFHDGVMIPLGDVAGDMLPWKGWSTRDAEPAVPRQAKLKVLTFQDRAMAVANNQECLTVEATLQSFDRDDAAIE